MSWRPAVLAGMVVVLGLISGTMVVIAGGPVCYQPVVRPTPYPLPIACGPLPRHAICPECSVETLLEGTVDLASTVFAFPFKVLDSCQDKFLCPPDCLPGPVQRCRQPYCVPLCPVPAWRPSPLCCPPPVPVCGPMQYGVPVRPALRYGPVVGKPVVQTTARPAHYAGTPQIGNSGPLGGARRFIPQVQGTH